MNFNYRQVCNPNVLAWGIAATLFFMIGLGGTMSGAKQVGQSPPTVTNATVPFYPPGARIARIQGVVRLRLSTDGQRVSAISVVGGPAALIPAAEENVRTWQFNEHIRTTFETTFRYTILAESECGMDNGTVLLRLPTEVEVTAKGVQTCDPILGNRPR